MRLPGGSCPRRRKGESTSSCRARARPHIEQRNFRKVHNTQQPHPRATPQEETDTIMATILDIRRTELAHTIERLREQRAQIDEKLRKLEQELESLKEFVPATDGE